jgi:hypothetical protein
MSDFVCSYDRRKFMKRIAIPIIFFVAAVVLLTGCGGGGGGSNGGIQVKITGPTGSLNVGGQATLTATVTGATNDTSVGWSIVEGAAGGTLTNSSVNQVTYTAPNAVGTFHVKATSAEDSTKSATFAITVVANPDAISVVVNGPTGSLAPEDSVVVTATVSGAVNSAVTWSIVEGSPAGGTLSSNNSNPVTYTAPTVENTYHIKATSVENPAKSGTAAIVVSLNPPDPPSGVSKK